MEEVVLPLRRRVIPPPSSGAECAVSHHQHDDACGHIAVRHNDHVDYLVGKTLHHTDDQGHCSIHGVLDETAEVDSLLEASPAVDSSMTGVQRRNARFMRMAAMSSSEEEDAAAVPSTERAASDRAVHQGGGIRFLLMLCLTGTFMVVEMAVGLITHSLALQADAFHMISDVLALIIGYVATRLARRTRTATASYGFARMTTVGALINAVFLLSTCLSISLEAFQRLGVSINAETVNGSDGGAGETARSDDELQLLMIVGGCGLAVNVLGIIIFSVGHGGGGGHGHSHGGGHGHSHGGGHGHSHGGHGHSHGGGGSGGMSSNIKGVLAHVIGDALGSVAVIISGLIMRYTTWPHRGLADPLCSLFIVLIISVGVIPLLKHSLITVLQMVPLGFDLMLLQSKIASVHGVLAVHDLHVWQLEEGRLVASVHVVVDRRAAYATVLDDIKLLLHNAGVHASTVQPEYVSEALQRKLEAAAVATVRVDTAAAAVLTGASLSPNVAASAADNQPAASLSASPGSSSALARLLELDMCSEIVCSEDCTRNSCCPGSPLRPAHGPAHSTAAAPHTTTATAATVSTAGGSSGLAPSPV